MNIKEVSDFAIMGAILFANLRGSKNVTPADPQFNMFGISIESDSLMKDLTLKWKTELLWVLPEATRRLA